MKPIFNFPGKSVNGITYLMGMLLSIFIGLFSSCAKDKGGIIQKKTPDTPSVVVVVTPCALDSNTVIGINGEKILFTSVMAGENMKQFGNYGIDGSASTASLKIEFKAAPATGKYITTSDINEFNWKSNNCFVRGVFSNGASSSYTANSQDTVYVYKTGADKYKVQFCKATFKGTGGSFNSKGSLSSD